MKKLPIAAGIILSSILFSGCTVAQEQLSRPILASDFSDNTKISNADLVSCARGNKIKEGEYTLIDSYGLCPDELQNRVNEGVIKKDEISFDVGRSENMERQEQEQRLDNENFQIMQNQELNDDFNTLNRVNAGAIRCGLHPRLCGRGFN